MRTTTNRRQFLENAAGAALAIQLSGSLAWAADDKLAELRKHADPLALAKNGSLPEAENAYPLLMAAAKQLTQRPGDYEAADCFRRTQPDEKRDRLIGAWLDENERVAERIEQAIRRGNLEYPAWQEERFDDFSAIRDMARFLQIRSQRLAARGKLTAAIQASEVMSQVFRLFKDGGGVLVEFLVASACEKSAWELMRRLAQDPKVDANQLDNLLANLPIRKDSLIGLRRAIQSEFTYYFLPQLANADGRDVVATLCILNEWGETDDVLKPRLEQAERCAKLAEVFAGHAKPFDAIDTAKRGSATCVGQLRDLETTWTKRKAPPAIVTSDELTAWPKQLRFDDFVDQGEAEEVTQQQLAEARKQFGRVKNPIGKMVLDSTSMLHSEDMLRAALSNQACFDGTRLFIAVCLYNLQHGVMPSDLQQLVTAKTLDALPLDPFSNRAFQYSREQKAVWSVGWDGRVSPQNKPDENNETDFDVHLWRFDAP